jgi:hypothetical protein
MVDGDGARRPFPLSKKYTQIEGDKQEYGLNAGAGSKIE